MSNWNQLNPSRREMIQRSLNRAGEGDTLLQTYINRTIQQLTIRELGLSAVIPRKAGQGDKEYINVRTTLGAISGTVGNDGGSWVTDNMAVDIQTGTYAQKEFAYKTLVTRGKVTRKLQATGRSYGDILAMELQAKAEDFNQVLEHSFINGDSGRAGRHAHECLGYLTIMNGYLGENQIINAGATALPVALTLQKLDETIDMVKGSSNRSDLMIVCSRAGHRELNKLLQSQQQFNDVVEISAGFRVRTYDGVPIIQSTEVLDTYELNTSNILTDYTGGTGTGFFIINKRYAYVSELTPTSVMPLAKTDSQFDQFDMFWDGTPVLSNPFGGAALLNVSV
ncbi:MAG: SU10 major capsid protein [Vampirovibrionia bacterium]